MTGLLKRRRYPTRGSLYFLLFILAGTAATTLPEAARANDVAIDAIINHPAVAAARARVCQSASQYDLAVARERPQVDFSLRGGTSLKSRFERRDTNSPHSRRFDDEDVDAVIGINQLLFDWGGVDASKRVALSEQAGNRISLSLEIDRVAADIIDLGIKLSEQQQRFDLFTQYKKDLASETQVIEQEIESLRRGIEEREAEARQARIQISTIDEQIALIEEERAVIKPLVDQGFEPRVALLGIDGRLKDVEERRHATVGREELARLAAGRMESELETARRRLQSMNHNFRAQAETQLVEMRANAAQAEARLEALKEKVALTAVRAPVDGIITAVHVNTIGGVVDGGTVMAEMVPIEGEVTVRARVNTDDVSKITVGQDVRISLTAYDVSRYGTLTGEVQKIANNSTQEENLPPYFVTLIKIPDPQFEQSGFVPEVVPGMTVIVDVLGGKRKVMNYILSPIERAQSIAFREK